MKTQLTQYSLAVEDIGELELGILWKRDAVFCGRKLWDRKRSCTNGKSVNKPS